MIESVVTESAVWGSAETGFWCHLGKEMEFMPVNPIVCIKRRSTCQTKRGFPFNPSTKEENWSVLSEIYFSRCIRSNVDGDTFLSSSGLKKIIIILKEFSLTRSTLNFSNQNKTKHSFFIFWAESIRWNPSYFLLIR